MPKSKKFYKKKNSKYVPKSIKSYVSKQLKKNIELKQRIYTYDSVGKDIVNGTTAQSFYSVSFGTTAIASALCAGIANGTGEGQRIGNRIRLKGIQVNFALQPGDNTNYLRFVMVAPYGEVAAGSVASFVQQVLCNTASSATQWAGPADSENFKILLDKHYYLTFKPLDGSTATTLPQTRFMKKFIKLNKDIQWDLSTDAIPNREVYMIAVSDSAAINNPGAVAGFIKLWYTDA